MAQDGNGKLDKGRTDTDAGDEFLSPLPSLIPTALSDKYNLNQSRIFITGTQAIVRLALLQKARDEQAGLNTAGFISGYRGSPLGGLDQQLTSAKKELTASKIIFQPGLNEELAATACWGTQQAELRGEGKYQGVFSIWYGKGPGVDRCGDVFRHANMAGTSTFGGVLALMGDDHTAESSTTAHQSEFHFVDQMIPILNPAGVQEILDYGLYGIAMSRFCGTWVALKCVKDNVESTASIVADVNRVQIKIPKDFVMPEGGLNVRLGDTILGMEARLHDYKRDAMLAFIKANNLNKIITMGGKNPRIGIITTGKSYLDVRQAWDDLGIDETKANDLGLRLFKVACPWPLSKEELIAFANGLDLIMVVEEKRSLIEVQVREELYGNAHQPTVIGKKDESGNWLFPAKGALDAQMIAVALAERILAYTPDELIAKRLKGIRKAQERVANAQELATRTPYFCSGCPHNSSTKIPEGTRAYAGIGCHYMVQWMDRNTTGFTQMGGEGANWIGEAPFSTREHVFQNLGDGTYNHSGVLALRWAVDTKTRMTYKILFNDAVAMTGGQPHEGGLTVDMVARQVKAEGVSRIALVSDDLTRYTSQQHWPEGLTFHEREDLDAVQRDLMLEDGVSVLIYDQTCAAEKRRRRKRGTYPDPDKRVIINELVCEGCGDCGVASNCVSIQPLETEFGRKRTIDQSSCNKDYSCVNGFCPSFVTVEGAKMKKVSVPSVTNTNTVVRGLDPRIHGTENIKATAHLPKPERASALVCWNEEKKKDVDGKDKSLTRPFGSCHDEKGSIASPPNPILPPIAGTYSILINGMGGTGIVTIGAILGMAAHLEGKGCGMIDMAGLAQKGGAVFSHVRLANTPEDIHSIRVAAGDANLVLGCDLIVTGSRKVLSSIRTGKTTVVLNTSESLPGDFTRDANFTLPSAALKKTIEQTAGEAQTFSLDATFLATALLGNAQAANMLILGYAYQKGAIPLSSSAIQEAIRLNGQAIEMNLSAFQWGRIAAHNPQSMEALLTRAHESTPVRHLSRSLEEMVERRVTFLTAYQNAAYATRYETWVKRVKQVEKERVPYSTALSEAVARYLFKLMAYKDEYEVARLYTDGAFLRQVASTFEGKNMRFTFHLAPPLFAKKDPHTGVPRKITFGPWIMKAFQVLARFKGLRGTWADPFGYTHERKRERQLITDYEQQLESILTSISPDNHDQAVKIASLPEHIRGFGHVKAAHIAQVEQQLKKINVAEKAPSS
jgi:indolepyruvate ferredoxin oxidoreductase